MYEIIDLVTLNKRKQADWYMSTYSYKSEHANFSRWSALIAYNSETVVDIFVSGFSAPINLQNMLLKYFTKITGCFVYSSGDRDSHRKRCHLISMLKCIPRRIDDQTNVPSYFEW